MTCLNPHAVLRQRQEPVRDSQFLIGLRSKPSVISGQSATGSESVVAGHFRWNTDGGMGKKPSDWFANPLKHFEHMRQGELGEPEFWLEAVNENPMLLNEFIKGFCRWKYFEQTGKVPTT